MMKMNSMLSGYVVGLGKVRADGSTEYRLLEKPIKNTIVKQGLNKWFTHNGNNSSIVSGADGDSKILPTANIRGMTFGDGGSATDFATTTDLTTKAQPVYETLYNYNWPYQGTAKNTSDPDAIKYRWTTVSAAASSPVSDVKEIGIYKKENGNYYLFARVVLPSTFKLYSGEKLICTYELNVSYPYRNFYYQTLQTELEDANGHNLQIRYTQEVYFNSNNDVNTIAGVRRGQNNLEPSSYSNCPMAWGAYCRLADDGTGYYGSKDTVFYKESAVPDPNLNGAFPTNYSLDTGPSHPIVMIQNYVPDTFERVIKVSLPHLWPNMTETTDYRDIWYMNFRTLAIRFGYEEGGVWVPSAWRKTGNMNMLFSVTNSFKTQDAIDWLDGH